ncbi:DUF5447 family protein [Pseudomonas sp. MOB-449]|nr:DUF5447 family protein [Pseudomonas sp. MOB-449]
MARAENCVCSVCWFRRKRAKSVLSRSLCCEPCRPVRISRGVGRRVCQPASFYGKHRPARRAPKYWIAV